MFKLSIFVIKINRGVLRLPYVIIHYETFEFVIKSPCRHSVLDLSLPRTRYGGIQCFQAVIDSAPIFIGVTRRNDVRGRFSKVSL